MIRQLERVAVWGLTTAIALLTADALAHRGPRFLWMLPHRALMHHRWESAAGALFRARPALVTGLLLLVSALFVALAAGLIAAHATITRRASPGAGT